MYFDKIAPPEMRQAVVIYAAPEATDNSDHVNVIRCVPVNTSGCIRKTSLLGKSDVVLKRTGHEDNKLSTKWNLQPL